MTTMKTIRVTAWCALLVAVLAPHAALAQFPEDVLRYSWQGTGPGGRSLAMGTSGMSFLDDYTAVYWNPAGIAQSKMNDFSFGLSHLSYRNGATYLGTQSSFSNNQTSLDHLGLVYAVPTTRGSLSVGIGYDRSNDFTTGLSFEGFNAASSIIQAWAPDGLPYPADLTRAEALELARVDTVNGTFVSPIADSVGQSGTTLEGGGMNRFSLSGAAEVARNLYVGIGLNFLSGSYSYSNRFSEADTRGIYQSFPFDYDALEVLDVIDADISGFNVNAGMIYRFSPHASFGLSVRTPSWITVQETFASEATSWFDDGSSVEDPQGGDPGAFNEYDIATPYVFSTGLSGGTEDFTLAGALEYTDYTQMEFRNATSDLLSLNTDIKQLYRETVNIRLGAEARIPRSDFFVRAGFILLPSPYEGDPDSFNQKYYTGGVGFMVDNSVGIDLSYAH
jgi:long-subunit fatty acid transport protein